MIFRKEGIESGLDFLAVDYRPKAHNDRATSWSSWRCEGRTGCSCLTPVLSDETGCFSLKDQPGHGSWCSLVSPVSFGDTQWPASTSLNDRGA